MKMPLLLKIVIGLLIIALISKLITITRFFNINDPSTYALNLVWIIIIIGIIKGLLSRSNIARLLARGLTIIGLIATGIGLFFIMTVPFPNEGEMKIAMFFSIAALLTELFIIFTLSSKNVIEYYNARTRSPRRRAQAFGVK